MDVSRKDEGCVSYTCEEKEQGVLNEGGVLTAGSSGVELGGN